MCRRKGLKVNASENKVMVLGGEEDWSVKFAWTGCDWSMCWNLNIWDVFWTNQVQMRQSVRIVAGAIRSLANAA